MNREPVIRATTLLQKKHLKEFPIEHARDFLKALDRKKRRKYGEMARRAKVSLLELLTGYDEETARANVIARNKAAEDANATLTSPTQAEPIECSNVGLPADLRLGDGPVPAPTMQSADALLSTEGLPPEVVAILGDRATAEQIFAAVQAIPEDVMARIEAEAIAAIDASTQSAAEIATSAYASATNALAAHIEAVENIAGTIPGDAESERA